VDKMPESAEAKLDRYQRRIEELQRKARTEEKVLKEKERRRRSTMLVSYGLLVMEEIKRGVRTEQEVIAQLNGILTQNSHRSAVGLPYLKEKKAAAQSPSPARTAISDPEKNRVAVATAKTAIAPPNSTNSERYAGVN
jgi:hypothetical protein